MPFDFDEEAFKKVVKELKRLNPEAQIIAYQTINGALRVVSCNIEPKSLVLPDGCEWFAELKGIVINVSNSEPVPGFKFMLVQEVLV